MNSASILAAYRQKFPQDQRADYEIFSELGRKWPSLIESDPELKKEYWELENMMKEDVSLPERARRFVRGGLGAAATTIPQIISSGSQGVELLSSALQGDAKLDETIREHAAEPGIANPGRWVGEKATDLIEAGLNKTVGEMPQRMPTEWTSPWDNSENFWAHVGQLASSDLGQAGGSMVGFGVAGKLSGLASRAAVRNTIAAPIHAERSALISSIRKTIPAQNIETATSSQLEGFAAKLRQAAVDAGNPKLMGSTPDEVLALAKATAKMEKFSRYEDAGEILGIAVSGGALQAKQGYEEALRAGVPAEDAALAYLFNFGAGTSEVVPVANMLKRIRVRSPKAITGMADKLSSKTSTWKTAGFEALEEAGQEAFQQLSGNYTARKFYDENRELMDGVFEAATIGGLSGGIFSSITVAFSKSLDENKEKLDAAAQKRLDEIVSKHGDLKKAAETITALAAAKEINPGTPDATPAGQLLSNDEKSIAMAALSGDAAGIKEEDKKIAEWEARIGELDVNSTSAITLKQKLNDYQRYRMELAAQPGSDKASKIIKQRADVDARLAAMVAQLPADSGESAQQPQAAAAAPATSTATPPAATPAAGAAAPLIKLDEKGQEIDVNMPEADIQVTIQNEQKIEATWEQRAQEFWENATDEGRLKAVGSRTDLRGQLWLQLTPQEKEIVARGFGVKVVPGGTIPGGVQVDSVAGGKNNWSSNPESLNKLGMSIPVTAELVKLPAGRYTLPQVRELLKGGEKNGQKVQGQETEVTKLNSVTPPLGGVTAAPAQGTQDGPQAPSNIFTKDTTFGGRPPEAGGLTTISDAQGNIIRDPVKNRQVPLVLSTGKPIMAKDGYPARYALVPLSTVRTQDGTKKSNAEFALSEDMLGTPPVAYIRKGTGEVVLVGEGAERFLARQEFEKIAGATGVTQLDDALLAKLKSSKRISIDPNIILTGELASDRFVLVRLLPDVSAADEATIKAAFARPPSSEERAITMGATRGYGFDSVSADLNNIDVSLASTPAAVWFNANSSKFDPVELGKGFGSSKRVTDQAKRNFVRAAIMSKLFLDAGVTNPTEAAIALFSQPKWYQDLAFGVAQSIVKLRLAGQAEVATSILKAFSQPREGFKVESEEAEILFKVLSSQYFTLLGEEKDGAKMHTEDSARAEAVKKVVPSFASAAGSLARTDKMTDSATINTNWYAEWAAKFSKTSPEPDGAITVDPNKGKADAKMQLIPKEMLNPSGATDPVMPALIKDEPSMGGFFSGRGEIGKRVKLKLPNNLAKLAAWYTFYPAGSTAKSAKRGVVVKRQAAIISAVMASGRSETATGIRAIELLTRIGNNIRAYVEDYQRGLPNGKLSTEAVVTIPEEAIAGTIELKNVRSKAESFAAIEALDEVAVAPSAEESAIEEKLAEKQAAEMTADDVAAEWEEIGPLDEDDGATTASSKVLMSAAGLVKSMKVPLFHDVAKAAAWIAEEHSKWVAKTEAALALAKTPGDKAQALKAAGEEILVEWKRSWNLGDEMSRAGREAIESTREGEGVRSELGHWRREPYTSIPIITDPDKADAWKNWGAAALHRLVRDVAEQDIRLKDQSARAIKEVEDARLLAEARLHGPIRELMASVLANVRGALQKLKKEVKKAFGITIESAKDFPKVEVLLRRNDAQWEEWAQVALDRPRGVQSVLATLDVVVDDKGVFVGKSGTKLTPAGNPELIKKLIDKTTKRAEKRLPVVTGRIEKLTEMTGEGKKLTDSRRAELTSELRDLADERTELQGWLARASLGNISVNPSMIDEVEDAFDESEVRALRADLYRGASNEETLSDYVANAISFTRHNSNASARIRRFEKASADMNEVDRKKIAEDILKERYTYEPAELEVPEYDINQSFENWLIERLELSIAKHQGAAPDKRPNYKAYLEHAKALAAKSEAGKRLVDSGMFITEEDRFSFSVKPKDESALASLTQILSNRLPDARITMNVNDGTVEIRTADQKKAEAALAEIGEAVTVNKNGGVIETFILNHYINVTRIDTGRLVELIENSRNKAVVAKLTALLKAKTGFSRAKQENITESSHLYFEGDKNVVRLLWNTDVIDAEGRFNSKQDAEKHIANSNNFEVHFDRMFKRAAERHWEKLGYDAIAAIEHDVPRKGTEDKGVFKGRRFRGDMRPIARTLNGFFLNQVLSGRKEGLLELIGKDRLAKVEESAKKMQDRASKVAAKVAAGQEVSPQVASLSDTSPDVAVARSVKRVEELRAMLAAHGKTTVEVDGVKYRTDQISKHSDLVVVKVALKLSGGVESLTPFSKSEKYRGFLPSGLDNFNEFKRLLVQWNSNNPLLSAASMEARAFTGPTMLSAEDIARTYQYSLFQTILGYRADQLLELIVQHKARGQGKIDLQDEDVSRLAKLSGFVLSGKLSSTGDIKAILKARMDEDPKLTALREDLNKYLKALHEAKVKGQSRNKMLEILANIDVAKAKLREHADALAGLHVNRKGGIRETGAVSDEDRAYAVEDMLWDVNDINLVDRGHMRRVMMKLQSSNKKHPRWRSYDTYHSYGRLLNSSRMRAVTAIFDRIYGNATSGSHLYTRKPLSPGNIAFEESVIIDGGADNVTEIVGSRKKTADKLRKIWANRESLERAFYETDEIRQTVGGVTLVSLGKVEVDSDGVVTVGGNRMAIDMETSSSVIVRGGTSQVRIIKSGTKVDRDGFPLPEAWEFVVGLGVGRPAYQVRVDAAPDANEYRTGVAVWKPNRGTISKRDLQARTTDELKRLIDDSIAALNAGVAQPNDFRHGVLKVKADMSARDQLILLNKIEADERNIVGNRIGEYSRLLLQRSEPGGNWAEAGPDDVTPITVGANRPGQPTKNFVALKHVNEFGRTVVFLASVFRGTSSARGGTGVVMVADPLSMTTKDEAMDPENKGEVNVSIEEAIQGSDFLIPGGMDRSDRTYSSVPLLVESMDKKTLPLLKTGNWEILGRYTMRQPRRAFVQTFASMEEWQKWSDAADILEQQFNASVEISSSVIKQPEEYRSEDDGVEFGEDGIEVQGPNRPWDEEVERISVDDWHRSIAGYYDAAETGEPLEHVPGMAFYSRKNIEAPLSPDRALALVQSVRGATNAGGMALDFVLPGGRIKLRKADSFNRLWSGGPTSASDRDKKMAIWDKRIDALKGEVARLSETLSSKKIVVSGQELIGRDTDLKAERAGMEDLLKLKRESLAKAIEVRQTLATGSSARNLYVSKRSLLAIGQAVRYAYNNVDTLPESVQENVNAAEDEIGRYVAVYMYVRTSIIDAATRSANNDEAVATLLRKFSPHPKSTIAEDVRRYMANRRVAAERAEKEKRSPLKPVRLERKGFYGVIEVPASADTDMIVAQGGVPFTSEPEILDTLSYRGWFAHAAAGVRRIGGKDIPMEKLAGLEGDVMGFRFVFKNRAAAESVRGILLKENTPVSEVFEMPSQGRPLESFKKAAVAIGGIGVEYNEVMQIAKEYQAKFGVGIVLFSNPNLTDETVVVNVPKGVEFTMPSGVVQRNKPRHHPDGSMTLTLRARSVQGAKNAVAAINATHREDGVTVMAVATKGLRLGNSVALNIGAMTSVRDVHLTLLHEIVLHSQGEHGALARGEILAELSALFAELPDSEVRRLNELPGYNLSELYGQVTIAQEYLDEALQKRWENRTLHEKSWLSRMWELIRKIFRSLAAKVGIKLSVGTRTLEEHANDIIDKLYAQAVDMGQVLEGGQIEYAAPTSIVASEGAAPTTSVTTVRELARLAAPTQTKLRMSGFAQAIGFGRTQVSGEPRTYSEELMEAVSAVNDRLTPDPDWVVKIEEPVRSGDITIGGYWVTFEKRNKDGSVAWVKNQQELRSMGYTVPDLSPLARIDREEDPYNETLGKEYRFGDAVKKLADLPVSKRYEGVDENDAEHRMSALMEKEVEAYMGRGPALTRYERDEMLILSDKLSMYSKQEVLPGSSSVDLKRTLRASRRAAVYNEVLDLVGRAMGSSDTLIKMATPKKGETFTPAQQQQANVDYAIALMGLPNWRNVRNELQGIVDAEAKLNGLQPQNILETRMGDIKGEPNKDAMFEHLFAITARTTVSVKERGDMAIMSRFRKSQELAESKTRAAESEEKYLSLDWMSAEIMRAIRVLTRESFQKASSNSERRGYLEAIADDISGTTGRMRDDIRSVVKFFEGFPLNDFVAAMQQVAKANINWSQSNSDLAALIRPLLPASINNPTGIASVIAIGKKYQDRLAQLELRSTSNIKERLALQEEWRRLNKVVNVITKELPSELSKYTREAVKAKLIMARENREMNRLQREIDNIDKTIAVASAMSAQLRTKNAELVKYWDATHDFTWRDGFTYFVPEPSDTPEQFLLNLDQRKKTVRLDTRSNPTSPKEIKAAVDQMVEWLSTNVSKNNTVVWNNIKRQTEVLIKNSMYRINQEAEEAYTWTFSAFSDFVRLGMAFPSVLADKIRTRGLRFASIRDSRKPICVEQGSKTEQLEHEVMRLLPEYNRLNVVASSDAKVWIREKVIFPIHMMLMYETEVAASKYDGKDLERELKKMVKRRLSSMGELGGDKFDMDKFVDALWTLMMHKVDVGEWWRDKAISSVRGVPSGGAVLDDSFRLMNPLTGEEQAMLRKHSAVGAYTFMAGISQSFRSMLQALRMEGARFTWKGMSKNFIYGDKKGTGADTLSISDRLDPQSALAEAQKIEAPNDYQQQRMAALSSVSPEAGRQYVDEVFKNLFNNPASAGSVITEFLKPLVDMQHEDFFVAPSLDYAETDAWRAIPELVRKAWAEEWSRCNGLPEQFDVLAFVERIHDLHVEEGVIAGNNIPEGDVGSTMKAKYVEKTLDLFRKKFTHVNNIGMEVEGKVTESKLRDMVANVMIDARVLRDFPKEWFQFRSFDVQDLRRINERMAAQDAFGRNAAELANDVDALSSEVDGYAARYQKVLDTMRTDYKGAKFGRRFYSAMLALVAGRNIGDVLGSDDRKEAEKTLKKLRMYYERRKFVDVYRKNVTEYFARNEIPEYGTNTMARAAGTFAGLAVNNPGSAITQMAALFDPMFRLGLSAVSVRYVARGWASAIGEGLESIGAFAGLGAETRKLASAVSMGLLSRSKYDDMFIDMGQADAGLSQTLSTTMDRFQNESARNWLLRSVSEGQNIAVSDAFHIRRKLGGEKEKQAIGFRPLAPFSWLTAVANKALVTTAWRETDLLMGLLVKFYETYPEWSDVSLEEILKNDEMAAAFLTKWRPSGVNSANSIRVMAQDLAEYGLVLEDKAREWVAKGKADKWLSREDYASVMHAVISRISSENNVATMALTTFSSNGWRTFLSLLGWSFRRARDIAQKLPARSVFDAVSRGSFDEVDWEGMKKFGQAMAGLAAVTGGSLLVLNPLVDDYYENVLNKRRNLRRMWTGDDGLAKAQSVLENVNRYGSLGLIGEAANTALNFDQGSDNRGLSFDSRVLLANQVISMFKVAQEATRYFYGRATGKPTEWTYQTTRRALMASGGNGAIHAADALNELAVKMGGDSPFPRERAMTMRTSVGNSIRAAARGAGVDIKQGGFGTVPSTLSPFIYNMEMAVFLNDPSMFYDAYQKALQAAAADNEQDPTLAIAQRFSRRNPMSAILNHQPTASEFQKILNNMTPREASNVLKTITVFNAYASAIGASTWDIKQQPKLGKETLSSKIERMGLKAGGMRYPSSSLFSR